MKKLLAFALFAAFSVGLTAPAWADIPPGPPPVPAPAPAPNVAPDAAPDAAPDTAPALQPSKDAALKGCEDIKAPIQVPTNDDSLEGKLNDAVAGGNLFFAWLLVLLGGFLTALSPCVYPLIPITLSIFGARQSKSHMQGFLLSATYVSGMILLYTTLGVSFAALGFLAGSALQSPYITIGVALFCLVMAASMFGAFEFALPNSLQTRLSQVGGRGFKGSFLMGLVAGIIAAPCTGPVLSFILTLIARDKDIVKGAVLMFGYALGMGLPFLVLGTFSSAISRIPKSGQWMEIVKGVFGLAMIGAALYYLSISVSFLQDAAHSLAQRGTTLAVIGFAAIIIGAISGALHLSFKDGTMRDKIRKGAGIATSVWGIFAVIAWLQSGPTEANNHNNNQNTQNNNQQLANNTQNNTTNPKSDKTEKTDKAEIVWIHLGKEAGALAKFQQTLKQAKVDCKPVMIDFFADWCIACKELDKYTYSDPKVIEESKRFVNIKIDATEDTNDLAEIQKQFGVVGLPTVGFISGKGDILVNPRLTGFVDAAKYLPIIQSVR